MKRCVPLRFLRSLRENKEFREKEESLHERKKVLRERGLENMCYLRGRKENLGMKLSDKKLIRFQGVAKKGGYVAV